MIKMLNEKKHILFDSIIFLSILNFFLHFGIIISKPLILYKLAKSNEKNEKK
jgi:hypothetical protein